MDSDITHQTSAILPRLRARIAERGLSLADLARHTGIARSNLSTYLAGHRRMRTDTLERLADALDCDLDLVPRN